MSLKVLVIEDELPARSELLRKLMMVDPHIYVVDEILTVEEGIEKLPYIEADLIFCDIRLSDGLSFAIFEKVECHTPVIFTTAYDEYALKAFQVNSIDYLLKPIDVTALSTAIDKYKHNEQIFSKQLADLSQDYRNKEIFLRNMLVQEGEKIKLIKIDEVAYFFAEGKYVFLTTWEGKQHLTDFNLTSLTDLLNPTHFYKLNRQYIAHINAIESLMALPKSKIQILLKPDAKKEIVVSSERSADFKTWLKVLG